MVDETTQVQCNLRGDFEMIFRQLNNYQVQVYKENKMNLIPLHNYVNIKQPIDLECTEFLHENANIAFRGEIQ